MLFRCFCFEDKLTLADVGLIPVLSSWAVVFVLALVAVDSWSAIAVRILFLATLSKSHPWCCDGNPGTRHRHRSGCGCPATLPSDRLLRNKRICRSDRGSCKLGKGIE